MAKVYTSTIKLRYIKEHTCVACSNVYSYDFLRTIKGTSRKSPDAATNVARGMVDKAMRTDVNQQPCPACGLLQPDMVGQKKAKTHKWQLWLLIIVPGALAVILRACNAINANVATIALIAIAVLGALGILATELLDPNRDLEANRQRVSTKVIEGSVRTTQQRRAAGAFLAVPGGGRSVVSYGILLLVLLTPLMAAAPEGLRVARHWPLNEACYPPVVGPGDTTRIYMTQQIESMKGYYHGDAHVSLTGAGPAPIDAHAETSQVDWGSSIDLKDDEKRDSHRPWVDITIPGDAALANQKVDGAVHLELEYPVIAVGGSTFQVDHMKMDDTFPMKLATPMAGQLYNNTWWIGSSASLVILAAAAVGFIGAANRQRTPSTMTNSYPMPATG